MNYTPCNGLPCIKFKDKALVDKLRDINRAKVTIIGRPVLNVFRELVSIQLMINEIDIEPLSSGGLF